MTNRRDKSRNKVKIRAKPRRQNGGRLKRVVERNTEAVERIHRAVLRWHTACESTLERRPNT